MSKRTNTTIQNNRDIGGKDRKGSFLDLTISMKNIITGSFALLAVIVPLSYRFGRWMQQIEDNLEISKKEQELNQMRTELTLEYNSKMIEVQRRNAVLETKLELLDRKEASYEQ